MAEERGSHGNRQGGRKSFGSGPGKGGHGGNRGGKGFKPRGGKGFGGKDGKPYGGKRDGERSGRGGQGHGGQGHGGFKRGNGQRRESSRRGDEEESGRPYGNRHYSSDRDGRSYEGKRGEGRRFGRDDRRDERHGGPRGHNNHGSRDERGGQRREFTPEEKAQYREQKRHEYMSRSHRNSDGTVSFPSQNPYTDRRPGEPKMPAGLEWSMLTKDERERLRGLSKEHAENIGLHILAAFSLEESDPAWAMQHAQWAAKQASRVDFARETLALVAYRQGDYRLALREFKTAFRMNGYLDYLPFMADCERGLGEPKKAIELAQSDDAKKLQGDAKAEMFLVYAGALADLGMWNQAIEIVGTVAHSKGLPGEYRMRALQAQQYFLEEAGRSDEAVALDEVIDRFEERYADVDVDENDDTFVVDYDVQDLPEDLQAKLGVTPDDAQYAPLDDESGVNMDDETRVPEEEQRAGAELDQEPAQMMEENERMDEEGTMGNPDLSEADDIRQEPEVGDVEEQIKSELE